MSEALSLYELNRMIRSVIEQSLPDTFLITAEVASCDVKNHCYLTLIDKEDDTIRAEIRAVIWANRYSLIAPAFEEATGTKLAKGIKILFQAAVTFHERYGLKLTINNIDPSYTVGELAVRRREILERLAKEGLLEKNKELAFPLVPQRIGIISSATAAGYEDLLSHLEHNPYGYGFTCRLYEATMQGDRAEASILKALKDCRNDAASLDIVVIVRGGGGQVDLHCFDSYEIGKAVALLPLPLISGIGHQRDVTVVDEAASLRAKTPTAVADMIINRVRDFEDRVDGITHALIHGIGRLVADEREAVAVLSRNLEIAAGKKLIEGTHVLHTFLKGLKYSLKFIHYEKQRLKIRSTSIEHLDPKNILKRGYSITYSNGSAVKSLSEIEVGSSLRTLLHQGEIGSRVESKRKSRRKG